MIIAFTPHQHLRHIIIYQEIVQTAFCSPNVHVAAVVQREISRYTQWKQRTLHTILRNLNNHEFN